MKELHTLRDLEQVKALADPLRFRVLEAFSQEALTTKQVAERLGEKPTRLYHHVETLERAGLIRLIETRKNRGTLEKYYRAVAGEFIVDRKLLELTKGPRRATSGYESLFLSALEATLAEAQRSIAAQLINPVAEGRNALMYRHRFSGTEVEIKKLMGKIQGWIQECQAVHPGPGKKHYNLAIAFYPVMRKVKPRSGRRGKKGKEKS